MRGRSPLESSGRLLEAAVDQLDVGRGRRGQPADEDVALAVDGELAVALARELLDERGQLLLGLVREDAVLGKEEERLPVAGVQGDDERMLDAGRLRRSG